MENGLGDALEEQYTQHIPPPCDEQVEVLHADDDVLVVVKPSGLLSVPGRFLKDSVVQRMHYEYPDAAVVHRLDLDTSGIMVLAQTRQATSALGRAFHDRLVSKEYIALVYGEVEERSGTISLGIRPDPYNRPRQLIDNEAGKSAETRY